MIHDLKIGDYLACTYEFDCYAGIIFDISVDNAVFVSSMHAKGLSLLFKWSLKEDECWDALNNDIEVLNHQNPTNTEEASHLMKMTLKI